eukprot:184533_1
MSAAQIVATSECMTGSTTLQQWLTSNNINDSVFQALVEQDIDNVDELLFFDNTEIKTVLFAKIKIGQIAKLLVALDKYRNKTNNKAKNQETKSLPTVINNANNIEQKSQNSNNEDFKFSPHSYKSIKINSDFKFATNEVSNYGALYVSNYFGAKNEKISFKLDGITGTIEWVYFEYILNSRMNISSKITCVKIKCV